MISKAEVIHQFYKRVFEESYSKIFICLNILSETQIWIKPNTEIPAVGNLILHLCGNANQWIVSGIGGENDLREREIEFSEQINVNKTDLINRLSEVKSNIEKILERMPDHKLNEMFTIQGFHESGFSILIHVIEHFSYHTGQITTLTKLQTSKSTGYYDGFDLN